MKNKIVFINIFYEILEYACEFGLAYIVSRLVSFSLEGDTRQTVIFAVSAGAAFYNGAQAWFEG